jgi:D-alanyl-D-alanine carboxypeptidase
VPQPGARKDASPEREVVVASLETTATDAIAAVPSARPSRKVRNETASAPSKRTAKSTKSTRSAKADKAAARRTGGPPAYGVQVGAFKAPVQARAAMKLAMQHAPDLLRGTFASVGSQRAGKGTLYKALLVGLSQDDAQAACRRLKQRSQDCMVIRAATRTTESG